MRRCPLCGRNPLTVPILVLVALLIAGGLFALRTPAIDESRYQEIIQLRERVAALEARGTGTVHFHFPEVKSFYNNFDQKGFDMTPIPEAKPTGPATTGKASTQDRRESLRGR